MDKRQLEKNGEPRYVRCFLRQLAELDLLPQVAVGRPIDEVVATLAMLAEALRVERRRVHRQVGEPGLARPPAAEHHGVAVDAPFCQKLVRSDYKDLWKVKP